MKKTKFERFFERFKELFLYPHEDEDIGITIIVAILVVLPLSGLLPKLLYPDIGPGYLLVSIPFTYIILWMLYRGIEKILFHFWWKK